MGKSRSPHFAGQLQLETAKKAGMPFRNPPNLDAKNGAFELNVEVHEFNYTKEQPSPLDVGAPDVLKLITYNCLPVGPAIRVRRGQKFSINVDNRLNPVGNPPPAGDPTKPKTTYVAEVPRGDLFSYTNLHTHGLHISPADPSDNILACIAPGTSRKFQYTIPADHPSGTYWYHPHLHGTVAYQMSNGLAGPLIVEGDCQDQYPDLEDLPEIAKAKEQILVFQLMNLRYQDGMNGLPIPGKRGWVDADTIYNMFTSAVRSAALQVDDDDQDPKKTTSSQPTTINGLILPVMTMNAGELQRWRLIHAGWDIKEQLSVVDDQGNPTTSISFYEVALDGLTTGALTLQPAFLLAPGQRSDLLVKVDPNVLAGNQERTFFLTQSPGGQLPQGTNVNPLYLAKIKISGQVDDIILPSCASIANLRPFQSLANANPGVTWQFKLSGTDPQNVTPSQAPYVGHYTIDGTTFHTWNDNPLEIDLNSIHEWTLTATELGHPFHIHVNPFQVVAYLPPGQDGTIPGNWISQDYWRDTLFVNEGESYRIRMTFKDFTGLSVFHCHILDHEDQGMMMPLKIKDGANPLPAQEICNAMAARKADLQPLRQPVPVSKIFDGQGHSHTLAEFKGKKTAVVLFKGISCFACAEQLRLVVREFRNANDPDLAVVAISDKPIEDYSGALKALEIGSSDPVRVYISTPDHQIFRDFGCFENNEPRHGLYLIDPQGTVRAGFAGSHPFSDVPRIARETSNLIATEVTAKD